MAAEILIKGGTIVARGKSIVADVLVREGRIARIAPAIDSPDAEVIDASGCIVVYGLADVHVHLREPGFSSKETISSGSAAAAHGGYTVVCAMPNLSPAPDSVQTIAVEQDLIRRTACIDVRPYATITLSRAGEEVVDMESLLDQAVAFSDDGSGVQRDEVMLEAMRKAAQHDAIIAAHCEDNTLLHGGYIHQGEYCLKHGHKGICSQSEWGQIARDIELALETGCRYHVCHISTKESVEIIRKAQQKGVKVTCETGPHYLALTDMDLKEEGRFKMNPPLRSAEDRDALIEGIQDGTIACIATDHAPHTEEEKSRGLKGSAMGVVGLETAFAVVYTTLVRTGKITLEKMIELMSENPRRIFRLGGEMKEGQSADLAVFSLDKEFTVDPERFLSKGHSTPFEGMKLYGECLCTLYRGKRVWEKEN